MFKLSLKYVLIRAFNVYGQMNILSFEIIRVLSSICASRDQGPAKFQSDLSMHIPKPLKDLSRLNIKSFWIPKLYISVRIRTHTAKTLWYKSSCLTIFSKSSSIWRLPDPFHGSMPRRRTSPCGEGAKDMSMANRRSLHGALYGRWIPHVFHHCPVSSDKGMAIALYLNNTVR